MRRFIFSLLLPIGMVTQLETITKILNKFGIRVETRFPSHTNVHTPVDFIDVASELYIEFMLNKHGLPVTASNVQFLLEALNSSTDPPIGYYNRAVLELMTENEDKLKEAK